MKIIYKDKIENQKTVLVQLNPCKRTILTDINYQFIQLPYQYFALRYISSIYSNGFYLKYFMTFWSNHSSPNLNEKFNFSDLENGVSVCLPPYLREQFLKNIQVNENNSIKELIVSYYGLEHTIKEKQWEKNFVTIQFVKCFLMIRIQSSHVTLFCNLWS